MTRAQRDFDILARETLRMLLDRVTSVGQITLRADLGPHMVTIWYTKDEHTHLGYPDGDHETLVRALHNLLEGLETPDAGP